MAQKNELMNTKTYFIYTKYWTKFTHIKHENITKSPVRIFICDIPARDNIPKSKYPDEIKNKYKFE